MIKIITLLHLILVIQPFVVISVKAAIFAIPRDFEQNFDHNDYYDEDNDSDTYLTEGEKEAAYALIAENTWPNLQSDDEQLLAPGKPADVRHLRKLAAENEFLQRVDFFWFPNTVWELFFISQKQQGKFNGMPSIEMYHEFVKFVIENFPQSAFALLRESTEEFDISSSYLMMISFIEDILSAQQNGQNILPHPQDKYFISELYRLQLCVAPDFKITQRYHDQFPPRGFAGIHVREPRSSNQQVVNLIQALTEFHGQKRGGAENQPVYDQFMKKLFYGRRSELSGQCQSLLASAVRVELLAWRENKVVLFRYAEGRRLKRDFFPSRLGQAITRAAVLVAPKWEDLDVIDFPLESGHLNVPKMMFSYTLLAGFYQQADQCVFIRAYRVLTAPQSAHNTRARRNAASTIDDCMYALILTKVWVRSEGHKFFNLPRVELQMGLLNRDRNLFPSTKIFDPDLLKQQHRGVRFSSPFPRQPPSEYAQPEDFSPKSSLLFGGTEDPISPLSVSEDSPMVVFRRQPDLVSSMRGNIPTLIKQLSDAARSISRSNSMISLSSDGGGENEQPPFTPRRYSKYAVELEESINTFAFRLNEILTGGSIVPMTLHSSLIDLDQWIQSLGSFNSYSNDDGSHDKTTDAIQRMHRLLNNQQLAGRYIWRTKSQPLESALTRSLRTSFEAPSGSDNLNGIGKYLPPIRTNSRLNLVTDEEGEAVEGKRRVADVAVDANNPSDWRMFADETNVDDQQSEPGYYSADSGGSSTMARSQPIAIRGGMKRYRSWPRGHPRE